MGRYSTNSCPSGYKTGTLEMDVPVNNITQVVMFQICVPRTDEDDLVLGLGLGLGLGIPTLVILAIWIWCCCLPRRRQTHLFRIQEQEAAERLRNEPPSVALFNYLGQNLHRQFNTGILTDDLRAIITVAPARIRDHMITVARENNRQELLDYILASGLQGEFQAAHAV
jgi:hypothetical protein